MKKLCVFDLDGTLIDSIDGICRSVNYALERLSQPTITSADCQGMVGNGARALCERALPKDSGELLDRMFHLYYEHYLRYCTENVSIYDGIPEMLAKVKERGISIAVLSNKPAAQTGVMVDSLFAPGAFSMVLGHSDRFPRKPDPASLQFILDKLEYTVAETVYVGDSAEDIEVARAIACKSIGVSWGFRGRTVLEQAGADAVADTPAELAEYIVRS